MVSPWSGERQKEEVTWPVGTYQGNVTSGRASSHTAGTELFRSLAMWQDLQAIQHNNDGSDDTQL